MTYTRPSLTGAAILAVAISLLLTISSLFADTPLAGIKIGAEQTPGRKNVLYRDE